MYFTFPENRPLLTVTRDSQNLVEDSGMIAQRQMGVTAEEGSEIIPSKEIR